MSEKAIFLLFFLVIFLIIIKIFKSLFRAILISVIAVILFRIVWIYSADDLFTKWQLEKIIKEEHQQKVYQNYEDYRKRSNNNSIIDFRNIDKEIKGVEKQIKKELNK